MNQESFGALRPDIMLRQPTSGQPAVLRNLGLPKPAAATRACCARRIDRACRTHSRKALPVIGSIARWRASRLYTTCMHGQISALGHERA